MAIANKVAGFSLGQADILRRAMGKKKPEEMEKLRVKFLEGAQQKKIPEKKAEKLYELIQKFAGYGFNKSHAAAYAVVCYQTAYLKAHYPTEFMAALMTTDMGNQDKIVGYFTECRGSGHQGAGPRRECKPETFCRRRRRHPVRPGGDQERRRRRGGIGLGHAHRERALYVVL